MSRMGKHVEDTRSFESKPMFVDQHPQVPREAPRVTGNIQHPLGVETDYRCQHLEGKETGLVSARLRCGAGSAIMPRLPLSFGRE